MDKENAEEFFERLLGFGAGWSVTEIEQTNKGRTVELSLEYVGSSPVQCPECNSYHSLYDFARERRWRHLDMWQYETRIRARIPRCNCPECGVRQIKVPWAEPDARYTLLFEAHAIEVLKAARSTSQACGLLGISWSTANTIMKRAVERGLERRNLEELLKLGIDEKSFRAHHRYISTLCDLEGGRVLEVVEGRTEEDAVELLESLPEETRDKVEAIALDMWPAFINAATEVIPQAEMVHDRFHVSKHLNEGVNKVRATEHKILMSQGDERLKGTRNLWLWNEANLSDKQYLMFKDIKDSEMKTARAWFMKESFRYFWDQPMERDAADEYFKQWYKHVIYSKIEPMKAVARMLKKHIKGLLSWCNHRITNAVTEGLNSKIQSIKSAARGFHTFESYRTRILFFCGKLSLNPCSTHSNR